MKLKILSLLIVIASSVLFYSPVKAVTIVETFSHWDGGSSYEFGGVNPLSARRAGQTFQVPADNNVLHEFSLAVLYEAPVMLIVTGSDTFHCYAGLTTNN